MPGTPMRDDLHLGHANHKHGDAQSRDGRRQKDAQNPPAGGNTRSANEKNAGKQAVRDPAHQRGREYRHVRAGVQERRNGRRYGLRQEKGPRQRADASRTKGNITLPIVIVSALRTGTSALPLACHTRT